MRVLIAVGLAATALSSASFAQSNSEIQARVGDALANITSVSFLLHQKEPSFSDIALVGSIGCEAFDEEYKRAVSEAGNLLVKNYPTKDVVQKENIQSLINYEADMLYAFKQPADAKIIVATLIQNIPDLPDNFPETNLKLIASFPEARDVACAVRNIALVETAAPAPASLASLGWSIAKGVVGIGVILGDAAYSIETGMAGAALGMISGGWGWNRVEETFSEIGGAWNSDEVRKITGRSEP